MGLNFRNSTSSPVYVAYAYPDTSCSPVTYTKVGWYRIEPGQTRQVWIGYAGGNTFYYYAESETGRVWSGSYFTQVPDQPFEWCWDTGCTTCREVGFRRLNIGILTLNYTVNLISSSSQRSATAGNVRPTLPTKIRIRRSSTRRIPLPMTGKIKKGKPRLLARTAVKARAARRR